MVTELKFYLLVISPHFSIYGKGYCDLNSFCTGSISQMRLPGVIEREMWEVFTYPPIYTRNHKCVTLKVNRIYQDITGTMK